MRVQRQIETTYLASGFMVPSTLIAIAAPDRIYLRLSLVATATNAWVTTKSPAVANSGQLVGTALGYLEFNRRDHGLLTQIEWYGATNNGVMGQGWVTVLEVYEEETDPGFSPRGIMLPGARQATRRTQDESQELDRIRRRLEGAWRRMQNVR